MPAPIVMLVEDNDDDATLMKRYLKHHNPSLAIVICMSGEDALEVLRTGDLPSLILLDLRLPGMHGLDFLVRIKKTTRLARIPVIIVTGDMMEVSKSHKVGSEHHIDVDFLVKPVDFDQVVEICTKLGLS